MRMLVWFLLLAWPCASLSAPEPNAIRNWFNVGDGLWIVPSGEIVSHVPAALDMELDLERNEGKVFAMQMDLDGDGAPEYFVQNTSTCGNGGCPYAIYGGRSVRLLGEMFGATFELESGAALVTVVGVLIEVPVMLSVVGIVTRSKGWYERSALRAEESEPLSP